DSPVHRGHELAHEREPYAGADRLARQLVRRAVEELEDPFHLPLRNAGPEVPYREQHPAVALAATRELDNLALRARGELQRVVDEVDDDLREAVRVDHHLGIRRVVTKLQSEAGALHLRIDLRADDVEELGRLHALELDGRAVAREPRELQHVLDEPR